MGFHTTRAAAQVLVWASLLSAWVAAPGARADELTLKDGAKISGTIVGFEQQSFKVKTSYGFALVQKDKVVSIRLASKTKSPSRKEAKDGLKKRASTESAPRAAKAAASSAPGKTLAASESDVGTGTAAAPSKFTNTSAAVPALQTIPAAEVASPRPPTPEPIREQVSGNTYTNDTYRFQMYKPPDWEVLDGARSVLPGAIAAMGTGDQTTYLLIGQEPAANPQLPSAMNAMDARLRGMLDDFQPLGEKRVEVSGDPALEGRFRGSASEHDWSGVVVLVPHHGRLYTIFGMTRGDDIAVQIERNVINRAINSLHFMP